jgi:hypothetical protein
LDVRGSIPGRRNEQNFVSLATGFRPALPRSRTRAAIPPLPYTSSWSGDWLSRGKFYLIYEKYVVKTLTELNLLRITSKVCTLGDASSPLLLNLFQNMPTGRPKKIMKDWN